MNFSAIEDSVLEEKKRFTNYLSRFLKNSRILIILLIAAIITAVSVSIWIKSPEYQVLYDNLSNEDGNAIVSHLNQMNVPYQLTSNSGQLLVPKNKVHELRLRLAEKNLPKEGIIGFELLDKEKFGVSQFNQKINYQRALEGELSRTIQRINVVKNARVHLALPVSSLFLQDKKTSSASVILNLKSGQILDSGQTNAILHLISSSISDLSVDNITIVDQFGKLLNHSSLGYNQINDSQLQYSKEIEALYSNKIKRILEPLVGVGNVYAQVTAKIDFNSQEKTQEYYSPNNNHKYQSIRSRQNSIHDQMKKEQNNQNIPTNFSKNIHSSKNIKKNNYIKKIDKRLEHNPDFLNSHINHDYTVNYELNHTVSNMKMNTGEIKRLSAGVIINFINNKNGKLIPLTLEQIKNIEKLTCESIGYSKSRGDSIHVVNALFAKNNINLPIQLNSVNQFSLLQILFILISWFILILCLFFLLRKCVRFFLKNKSKDKNIITNKKLSIKVHDTEKNTSELHIEENLNIDGLIHKICNISNQNPRTIALIIRQWMSDKK